MHPSNDAMAYTLPPSAFVADVADAAAAVGLPRSVVYALGIAAEVVAVALAGHAPVTPEVDALRLALLPIVERANAAKQAA